MTRRWPPTAWPGPTRRRWPRPPGASPEARRDLGDTVNRIGRLLANTGRPREAEVEYRAALAIRRKLAEEYPAVSEYRNGLAASHNNLGILLWKSGRLKEAEAEYRTALAIRREAGRRQPRRRRVPQATAGQPLQPRQPAAADGPAEGGGGRVPRGPGDRAGAGRRQPRRARIPQAPGAEPPPPRPACCKAEGRTREAEPEYRTALSILQELAEANPAVTQYRSDLGSTPQRARRPAGGVGPDRRGGGRVPRGAGERPGAGRGQSQPSPSSATAWRPATSTSATCSPSRAGRRRRSPSTARRRRSSEELAAANPAVTYFRHGLAYTHVRRGVLLSQTGRLSEAEAEDRKAAAIYRRAGRPQPQGPRLRRRPRLGAHQPRRCGPPSRAGRSRPATPTTGRSPSASGWSRRTRRAPTYLGNLAASLRRRGLARRDLGDPAGGVADARRALALLDGLASRSRRGVVRDGLLPCRDGRPGRVADRRRRHGGRRGDGPAAEAVGHGLPQRRRRSAPRRPSTRSATATTSGS